jgi:hypothetical protein
MRKVLVWIMLVAFVLGGCATRTQTGVGVGAGLGAALGMGIGGALGGTDGALIGGMLGLLLGAATGATVGHHFENQQQRTRTEASQAHAYQPSHGLLLVVSGLQVVPVPVPPGEPVQVTVTYDVLGPEPNRQIPITETWVFKHKTNELTTISRPEELKEQGGYASTYTLAMAKDAPAGDYQATVTVSNGAMATTVATSFQVQP